MEIIEAATPHIFGINPDTVFGVLVAVLFFALAGAGWFCFKLLTKFSDLQRETLQVINNNTSEIQRLVTLIDLVFKQNHGRNN